MKTKKIDFFWQKLVIVVLVAINCVLFYLSSDNNSLFVIPGVLLMVYFFIKNNIKVFEWVQFYAIIATIGGLIGLIIEVFHSPIIESFTMFGLLMSSAVVTFVLATYTLRQYEKVAISKTLNK